MDNDQHATNISIDGRLSALSTQIKWIEKLLEQRHEQYGERDEANKAMVKAAFMAAEKASEKTEAALKEYKVGANEWRDTVKDLIAGLRESRGETTAKGIGKSELWGYIVQGLTLAGALGLGMHFGK